MVPQNAGNLRCSGKSYLKENTFLPNQATLSTPRPTATTVPTNEYPYLRGNAIFSAIPSSEQTQHLKHIQTKGEIRSAARWYRAKGQARNKQSIT